MKQTTSKSDLTISDKFTHAGYSVTRHTASYTQQSAEIVNEYGVNLFGGNIDAGIGAISHYQKEAGTDGRVNMFLATDEEIKEVITSYHNKITEAAPGLIRKLADANVKDLSPNEIHRAMKDTAMPKVCISRTKVLVSNGTITMQKVNNMLQEDQNDRIKTVLQDLKGQVIETLYWFVEMDLKLNKAISQGTVEAFKTQKVEFPALLNIYVK